MTLAIDAHAQAAALTSHLASAAAGTATVNGGQSANAAAAAGAASSGSLFTARLHREIMKFSDVSWRATFIDYQRLRKQIKKIVYYEQENKPTPAQPSTNTDASTPSQSQPALVPAPSTANRDRLRKSRDIFWCVLKAEIDKVNSFFALKEDEMTRALQSLHMDEEPSAGDTADDPAGKVEPGYVSDRIIFAKLLLEQSPPALTSRLVDDDTRAQVNQINWTALSQHCLSRVSVIQQLLTLCTMLDQLRKFVVINYVVVLKVLKKYEEYTHRNAKQEFLAELEEEPFYTSNKLTVLLNSAEKIAMRLLPHSLMQSPPQSHSSTASVASADSASVKSEPSEAQSQSQCPICQGPLQNPVQVNCEHRFCFDCIAKQTAQSSLRCPVCETQQEFDSLDLGLESVFSKFAGVRLTDKETWPQPTLTGTNAIDSNASVKHEFTTTADRVIPSTESMYNALLRKKGFGGGTPPTIDIPLKSDLDTDSGNVSDGSGSDDDSPTSSGMITSFNALGNSNKKDKGSCHQCKTTRDSKLLLCCTSKAEKGKRKRKCRKKYCAACLQRTYAQVMASMTKDDIQHWQCPACVGVCTCAACQRRGKETALENVGLPPPLNIPAELLASDPWAYALHSSSMAASAAQQAAAQAAAAIAAQQQLLQAQATIESQHQSLGLAGLDPNNPLVHQIHQSLHILQSLAQSQPQNQLQLATLHLQQQQQALAHLNAFGMLQQHARQGNVSEAESLAAIQAMQQFTAMQQTQALAGNTVSNATGGMNSGIPNSELKAAHAAAASSRERHRLTAYDRSDDVRLSKLNAFNFQAPPSLFLSSAPGSPSLSPMINRPQSPLSPISPGSAAVSPELRNRSIGHSLHKLEATKNLSMSVPSKTRSIAASHLNNVAQATAMEEPILNHNLSHSRGHSQSSSPSPSFASHHGQSRLSPMPHSDSDLMYSQSVPSATSAVMTAVGGDDMPSFHTGSVQYPQSVPSRTRTLASSGHGRPRSSLGRRGLSDSVPANVEGETHSHSHSHSRGHSPELPPLYQHQHSHSQLQSMSSRNPNKSLLLQQQQQQHGHQSQPQSLYQQSPREQSPGSTHRRASFNNEFEDEASSAAKRQQHELEIAYRLQMQLLALQQQSHPNANQNPSAYNGNQNYHHAGHAHNHSRANRSMSGNSAEIALSHQQALNALDNYSMHLQQQQHNPHQHYDHSQAQSQPPPLNDTGLFDRQSSFQLPIEMPQFNPFVRDASMNLGPRSLSAVNVNESGSDGQSSTLPTTDEGMEMSREMSAVNGLGLASAAMGFERGFSALMLPSHPGGNGGEEDFAQFGLDGGRGFSAAGQFDLERFASSMGLSDPLPMSMGLDRDLSALGAAHNQSTPHDPSQAHHSWRA